MRILHVIPGYGGGISSFVKNLAKGNTSNSIIYDVVGFTEYGEEFRKIIASQGGVSVKLSSPWKNPVNFYRDFRSVIKKNHYDILHCHISGYKGFVFKVIARISGVKSIITHAHRTDDEIKNTVITIWISRFFSVALSTYLIGCSKMAARFIFGKKGKNVPIIPNAIDLDKFLQQIDDESIIEYKNELGIEERDIVIGHIGRFNLQKNHDFIIKIAKKIREKNQKFKVVLIGDGELLVNIKNKVIENGLSENFIFAGRRLDVFNIVKVFDVMVLPSFFEGLPTVAIEAQAAGINCLLSDRITPEADMGLDLVKYLSIEEAEIWSNEILALNKNNKKEMAFRRKVLVGNGYDLASMQKKYLECIQWKEI